MESHLELDMNTDSRCWISAGLVIWHVG